MAKARTLPRALQLQNLRKELRRECPHCHIDVEAYYDSSLRYSENLAILREEIRQRHHGGSAHAVEDLLERYGAHAPREFMREFIHKPGPIRRAVRSPGPVRRMLHRIVPHPRILPSCTSCGRFHSSQQHRFHGLGSFKRTHR